MTLISKLSTLAAVGALLAAPVAMAQQSGTNANMNTGGKTNLNAGGSDHDTGMANSQGTSYHMGQQGSNFSGNTNNGWNASNTGDKSATSPQNTAVNTGGGQTGSSGR